MVQEFGTAVYRIADLLTYLLTQLNTRLKYETTDYVALHCVVCLFTSQLSLVLIIMSTHERMAKLSAPGRLNGHTSSWFTCFTLAYWSLN